MSILVLILRRFINELIVCFVKWENQSWGLNINDYFFLIYIHEGNIRKLISYIATQGKKLICVLLKVLRNRPLSYETIEFTANIKLVKL